MVTLSAGGYFRTKYPLLPDQESLKQIRKYILRSKQTVLPILNVILSLYTEQSMDNNMPLKASNKAFRKDPSGRLRSSFSVLSLTTICDIGHLTAHHDLCFKRGVSLQ